MGFPEESVIIWTGYMKHRAELRGFEFSKIENILRHSAEKLYVNRQALYATTKCSFVTSDTRNISLVFFTVIFPIR